MSVQTFIRLYYLPALIVVVGIIIYASVILVVEVGVDKISAMTQDEISRLQYIQVSVAHTNPTQDTKEQSSGATQDLNINESKQDEALNLAQSSVESNAQDSKTSIDSIQKQESGITDFNKIVESNAIQTNKPTITPTPQESKIYAIATRRGNVRKEPNLNAMVLISTNVNEQVEVLEKGQEWSKIKNNQGIQGYIVTRLLDFSVNENVAKQDSAKQVVAKQEADNAYIVIPNSLNVRSAPDSSGAIIGSVKKGAKLQALEITNGWIKIKLQNQLIGFVSQDFLRKL